MNNQAPLDFQKIGQQSAEILEQFLSEHNKPLESTEHITSAFMHLAEHWMQNPEQLMQMQMNLYQSYLGLWANMAEKMMGKEVEDTVQPNKGDRRFSDESWENHLVFDYIKQSYLLTCNWLTEEIDKTECMDKQKKAKVDFYTRQFLDAMSPSNFPMTNPEVLERAIETNGESLINGLQNLVNDMQRGEGKLKISMTDYDAFEIGKNIATTEGEVVYRNRIFELIQYKPKGKQVYEKPLLIFPPCINKYYLLDLQAKNSFVRYAVEECGLNVFLVSWKNPDENYRDVGFDTYMEEGILDAIDQTLAITKQKTLNTIGYCIGGTLLATTLAWMAKKKDKRVNSTTFFTTLIDFEEGGEMTVFIDDEQVTQLEKTMDEKGYLDGAEMAATFSMLRSNDLIWSFVVNNYLMGKDPFPFDLLYWNDDPTRLPAKFHSFYLRNMYIKNNLVKKDAMELNGEKIDITKIDVPIYMVSAINDHITPWQSCYSAMHKMKSNVRFVLGKAGHVAGVVCPPGNPKRSYWVAEDVCDDPDKWLKRAEQHQDSWWLDWKPWIEERSGKKIATPKTLGGPKHKPLCKAPGTYVKQSY